MPRLWNDTLDGGANTDSLDYSGDIAGVTVNLATGTATDGWGGTDMLSLLSHQPPWLLDKRLL